MITGLPIEVYVADRKLLEDMTSWCHSVIVDHWGWNEETKSFCFSFEDDANKFTEQWLK